MRTGQPSPKISVKAIGVLWRAGRLLAAEVRDRAGHLSGVRPLGGSVEFGETAEAAVIREFQEELGLAVTSIGPPEILQNIFVHDGVPGHEIVFAFSLECAEGDLPNSPTLKFMEDDGTVISAGWYDPEELDRPGGPRLYPAGLMARLPHLQRDAAE